MKLEGMFEMRIAWRVLSMCCALFLRLFPRMRKVVVGSGLGHLASKERDRCSMGAEVLPELEAATLRINLHSER